MTTVISGKKLASFEFVGARYKITKQSVDDIFIHIWRELRRKPFLGMKQPTPHGGFLGFQCVLEAKKDGLPAVDLPFILYLNKKEIQRGTLDGFGMCTNILVRHLYGNQSDSYLLKVFDINESLESCNTLLEEVYESGRLVNSSTHL